MIYKFLLFFFIMGVLLSCKMPPGENPAVQFEQRVGELVIRLISSSKKINISHIKNEGNFTFNAESVILSPKKIQELQKLLLNDKGYFFDKQKKCLFIPEIVFTFDGAKELTLFVSPLCKQIKIEHLKRAFVLDYDPMANELNSFMASLLDPERGLDRGEK